MDISRETPSTVSLPTHPSNVSDLHTANTDSTCFLTNLAAELIHHIIDYIPPASHIDFALTCKHLCACSTDVLKRHHDAHMRYGVSSDIDPTTIPTLLRSACGYGDPIPAWHVRSLEVWYDRSGWEKWKKLDFKTPIDQSTQSPIGWGLIPGEIDDYLERLDKGQDSLVPDRIDTARTQILDGHDSYMKALLITICPRLRDVKFVVQARDAVNGTTSCLDWLDMFIENSYKKPSWGPGLQNLQSVAVGLPSGTWMDDVYHQDSRSFGMTMLLQFLRLPQLERIYFKDCDTISDDETPLDQFVPAWTSSIKHLFLDNYDQTDTEFHEVLAAAPKALVTACFRAGDATIEGADTLVSALGTYQGKSLESLMFYDYHRNPDGINGYRCNAFRPEELNNYAALKHVCMHIQDIELEALYNADGCKEEWESDGAWLERCFFESVKQYEVLVLWGSLSNNYLYWEPTEEQGFEDAVISVLNGVETCMQAVYLEDVERNSRPISPDRGGPQSNEKDNVWFCRAIEVARKRGVDLHTLTNRNKPRHEIEFPEAPDKYDLKTGPWGERPGDWVFNVYTGRREPNGCGRCGDCDICLGNYSKVLWDGLKKQPRRVEFNGKSVDGTEDE